VVAGTRTLLGIASVSIAFALIPQALESHHLSPYLLGGIGLIGGTIVGPGGMGGNLLDILQKKKEVAILSAAGLDGDRLGEVDVDLTSEAQDPEMEAPAVSVTTTTNGNGRGEEIVLRTRPPRLRA
jgi:hypothetical protein